MVSWFLSCNIMILFFWLLLKFLTVQAEELGRYFRNHMYPSMSLNVFAFATSIFSIFSLTPLVTFLKKTLVTNGISPVWRMSLAERHVWTDYLNLSVSSIFTKTMSSNLDYFHSFSLSFWLILPHNRITEITTSSIFYYRFSELVQCLFYYWSLALYFA
jgi:hypothetical protein